MRRFLVDDARKSLLRLRMAKNRAPILQAIIDQIGTVRIADACGITPQAVCMWRKIPVIRVLQIERLTGIPRETLRPDIYGAPRTRPPTLSSQAA